MSRYTDQTPEEREHNRKLVDLTVIGAVVDRSGSMMTMASEMSAALATFLGEQQSQPGDVLVSLAQFDNEYDLLYSLSPVTATMLGYRIVPRGSTALLDAVGTFVTDLGARLAARPEEERPGKVIVVVVTDGYENASREWTREQVQALVEQQRRDYAWEFVFLGANIDAPQVAQGIGIPTASAMTFTPNNAAATMDSMNSYASTYRATGAPVNFTDEDRKRAVQP